MARKRLLASLMIFWSLILISVSGCSSAAKPEARVVRIGYAPRFLSGLTVNYLADKGLLDSPEYKVEWKELDTPATLAQAYEAGNMDIGANIGLTTILMMAEKGVPLKLISLDGYSSVGGIYSKKATSVGALKGLKLSVMPKAFQTTFVSVSMLRNDYGLNVDADTNVIYQSSMAAFALLTKGDVDAALLFGPEAIRARSQGYSELFNLNEQWKKDLGGTSMPISGNVVNPKFLNENKAFVEKFIQAHNDAVKRLQQDPEAIRALIVKWLGLSEADIPSALQEVQGTLPGAGVSPQLILEVKKLTKFSIDNGLVKTIPEDLIWSP